MLFGTFWSSAKKKRAKASCIANLLSLLIRAHCDRLRVSKSQICCSEFNEYFIFMVSMKQVTEISDVNIVLYVAVLSYQVMVKSNERFAAVTSKFSGMAVTLQGFAFSWMENVIPLKRHHFHHDSPVYPWWVHLSIHTLIILRFSALFPLRTFCVLVEPRRA